MSNKETMTYEEFKQMSQNLNASDVEIAVAAAFAGEGFEAVDCRDLAQAWWHLQSSLAYDEDTWSIEWLRGHMTYAWQILFHLEIVLSSFNFDKSYDTEWMQTLVREWAALILQRIYEVGDE